MLDLVLVCAHHQACSAQLAASRSRPAINIQEDRAVSKAKGLVPTPTPTPSHPPPARKMSAGKAYSIAASYFHWLAAAPLVGSIGCVLICQQSPKEEKGKWMYRHKSLGLLTGLVVAPRLGYRLLNSAKYKVGHVPGTGPVEGKLADASHLALYGFMTLMPATGIAMGYFGGKGLPFFVTTLPGASEKNGKIAGNSFKIHKTLGTYGKYLVPIHVGGALKHALGGKAIWSRVNPFGRPMH